MHESGHLGHLVELNCTRRSFFASFSKTLIWSPLQMRTTVASNVRLLPFGTVVEELLPLSSPFVELGVFA